jgi:hypothetical protein
VDFTVARGLILNDCVARGLVLNDCVAKGLVLNDCVARGLVLDDCVARGPVPKHVQCLLMMLPVVRESMPVLQEIQYPLSMRSST